MVESNDAELFLYWLRFEFGASGNPHAHGLNYVHGNPSFECVVEDEEQKRLLQEAHYPGAEDFRTKDEAAQELANFYCHYVRESHPAKDEQGDRLYDFVIENLMLPGEDKPQSRNLLPMLEQIFADPEQDPDLRDIKNLLLALIEDGNRHTWHSHREGPLWGVDPCARKVKKPGQAEEVYCRYLFPRELYVEATHDGKKGEVRDDPHRTNLRNLFLARNDTLINNFEEHLLLMNVGNIDWRPLINLWSVLEYLTKYTAKVGKATKHLGKLFGDVVATVCEYEQEDGVHDLWRRTIMKFYNRLLGNRDYSLFEVVHFGLRLPGTLSSFGPVESVSVSNWSSVKRGAALRALPKGDRVTHLSKLEIFNARSFLERPETVPLQALENLSSYAFWRLSIITRTNSCSGSAKRSWRSTARAGQHKRSVDMCTMKIMLSARSMPTCHALDYRGRNTLMMSCAQDIAIPTPPRLRISYTTRFNNGAPHGSNGITRR